MQEHVTLPAYQNPVLKAVKGKKSPVFALFLEYAQRI
jgi:hypothetical protein